MFGLLAASYGWMANFIDLPTTNNPIIGIVIGTVILAILMFGVFINQQKRIVALEKKIRNEGKELAIDIKRDVLKSTSGKAKVIRFYLTSNEDATITNCVAYITGFAQSSGKRQSLTMPVLLSFDGQDDADGVKIQRQGVRALNLAKRIKGEAPFEIMKYPVGVPRQYGSNRVVITINGQVSGVDRLPKTIIGVLSREEGQDLEFVYEEEKI